MSNADVIVVSHKNSNLPYGTLDTGTLSNTVRADVILTQITTVVFGNVATVVVSCKMLHWMQMTNESNVF